MESGHAPEREENSLRRLMPVRIRTFTSVVMAAGLAALAIITADRARSANFITSV
jgi:hypothetical protein